MTGYYNILLGMIDIQKLSWILSEDQEFVYENLQASYGVKKGTIDDIVWKKLIKILESDTFKNLLSEFLSKFTFPNELREQMIDLYNVDENKILNFIVDFSNIKLNYCNEIINKDQKNESIVLVKIEMSNLNYIILDPCITMLVSTYYKALLNFIMNFQKYSNISSRYYHNIECCSPWIEELLCLAFTEVAGDFKNGESCRPSEYSVRDKASSVPAYVLKSIKSATAEQEKVNSLMPIDASILYKDTNSVEIKTGAKNHLFAWRNRISFYMQTAPSASHTSNFVYIDSCYGYSYDYELFSDYNSLYGETDSVPSPLDWMIKNYCHDWLRVPFIKVPRFIVDSAEELYDLLKDIYSLRFLFRGQPSEYYLNRSIALMRKLYNDAQAKEPSLASYAVRTNSMFEKHYIEWATIIKTYLYLTLGQEKAEEYFDKEDDFNFYMLCLSIAQHYGLPTYGLDVSDSLATALFFALNEFTPIDESKREYKYTKKEKGNSIIYVFSPTKGESFNYNRFDLNPNLFPRPFMQKASFAHCSWGYAKNAIAERLVAAIQFDVTKIDFAKLNALLRNDHYPELYEKHFFSKTDNFVSFLRAYITNNTSTYNKDFKNYLKNHIYQI